MRTAEQRFREKVGPANANGCQLWTAYTNGDGYGTFNVGGRMVKAHRLAWELANGPIPAGLCALHRCDTPSCCNPAHLFLGTNADNNADMAAKGRGRLPDNRGSKHGAAKLTDELAVEIFHASGTQQAIAARLDISRENVSAIKRRVRWTHATEGLA